MKWLIFRVHQNSMYNTIFPEIQSQLQRSIHDMDPVLHPLLAHLPILTLILQLALIIHSANPSWFKDSGGLYWSWSLWTLAASAVSRHITLPLHYLIDNVQLSEWKEIHGIYQSNAILILDYYVHVHTVLYSTILHQSFKNVLFFHVFFLFLTERSRWIWGSVLWRIFCIITYMKTTFFFT